MKYSRTILAAILAAIILIASVIPFATAEEAQFTCRPTSATFSPFRGETEKEGYYFLTVNLEFENNTANTYALNDDIQCNLVYEDSFSAEGAFVECEKNTIDPLMLIKGSVEFEVPNMLVESAGSDLMLEFVIGGEATQQSLSEVDYIPSQYEIDRYEFTNDEGRPSGASSLYRGAYLISIDKNTFELVDGDSSTIYHLKSNGKSDKKYGKEYAVKLDDDDEEEEHKSVYKKDNTIVIHDARKDYNKTQKHMGVEFHPYYHMYSTFTMVKGQQIWKASKKKASTGNKGATNSDKDLVQQVQQKLNEAGFDCGTPDGIAGKKTKSAITAYQKDKGLEVTGTINDALLESLGIKH